MHVSHQVRPSPQRASKIGVLGLITLFSTQCPSPSPTQTQNLLLLAVSQKATEHIVHALTPVAESFIAMCSSDLRPSTNTQGHTFAVCIGVLY